MDTRKGGERRCRRGLVIGNVGVWKRREEKVKIGEEKEEEEEEEQRGGKCASRDSNPGRMRGRHA